MPDKTTEQRAEDALSEAAHGHHGPPARCATCKRLAILAVRLARLAQVEKDIQVIEVNGGPSGVLLEDRDRLRLEVEAMERNGD